ncbi:uncharacterized protein LOC132061887 [Lycium ferocissimum]|uniref:uncharacterized protein LOC132061887 n=1 Tax=Lycium ferocissimum TaxID=112874 RepID=UPI002814975F|nr:uncharacterized protein LOC132061887 [Lycium ferocissimum]
MVLGGDWMRSHSPVLLDFVKYKVQVTHKRKMMELSGIYHQAELKIMNATSVKQLLMKGHTIWAHLFTLSAAEVQDVQAYLGKSISLFSSSQMYLLNRPHFLHQEKVKYFGHIITGQGVSTDPTKIEAMTKWPVPKSLKSLRGFLGLTGYYRRFLRNYGIISRPLTNLLKKNAFNWSKEATGLTKLLGLDYEVQYKKGTENRVADALSRRQEDEAYCNAITTAEPTWMLEVSQSYEMDPTTLQLVTKLITDPTSKPGYALHQSIIRYKGKIYGGRATDLRFRIFTTFHTSPLGDHSGQQGTYRRIGMVIYWPNLKRDIIAWVSACDVYQGIKTEHVHSPGLLQPLPVPDLLWQDIAMDFIEGLPSSGHNNSILVVVDRLTKYGHFLPLKHPYIAKEVADLFLQEIYKLHGFPSLLSLTKILFLLANSGNNYSNPWGLNSTCLLLTTLSLMVGVCLAQRQSLLQQLKDNLHTAQARIKFLADKNRTDRVLQAGDWVYLKLQPYRQAYVAIRKNLKLSAKFYGLFQILEKIRSVAYHLDLPDGSQIHPVFHVS